MWAANPSNLNEFKYQFVPVETILIPVMRNGIHSIRDYASDVDLILAK